MTDTFTPEERSRIMRSVKSQDTKPEMAVRRLLHRLGYRYRLHAADLPGKPDIVFRRRKKVIFVHGCFWHQHPGCRAADRPSSQQEYWRRKLDRNMERDQANLAALRERGWGVLIVWECQARTLEALERDLKKFLESPVGTVSESEESVGIDHDRK